MKRKFLNKCWTFYPPIPAVLRIYRSMSGKPGLIIEKHGMCIIYTMKKSIAKMYSSNQRMFFKSMNY
jgi:hypothetical protein